MVLHLEASDEAMEERLLKLAEANGNNSDQERESIKKRIKAYRRESVPVLQHYEQQGKVVKLQAGEADSVFSKIKAILDPEEGLEFDECINYFIIIIIKILFQKKNSNLLLKIINFL